MNAYLNMNINLKLPDQNTLKLCLDLKSVSKTSFVKEVSSFNKAKQISDW